MRKHSVFIFYLMIISACLFVVGCGLIGNSVKENSDIIRGDSANEGKSDALTGRLNIFIDSDSRALIRASANSTATVTFLLTLIDPSSVTYRIATLSKIVGVVNGEASCSFSNVPIWSVIGLVHIDGGRVASFTDFHGALDLVAGENTMIISGVGGKSRIDVLTAAVRNIVFNRKALNYVKTGIVDEISQILQGLATSSPSLFDDILLGFYLKNKVLPSAPENVEVVASNSNRIIITWEKTFGASTYNLRWRTDQNASYSIIENASSPYVHTGLASGATYYYRVSAVNSGIESEFSQEKSATIVIRYSKDDQGIITDSLTGHRWAISTYTMNWYQAYHWVKNFGRLPTYGEIGELNNQSFYWGIDPVFSTIVEKGSKSEPPPAWAAWTSKYGIADDADIFIFPNAGWWHENRFASGRTFALALLSKLPPPVFLSATAGDLKINLKWNFSNTTAIMKTDTRTYGYYPSEECLYTVYWSNTPGVTSQSPNKITVSSPEFVHSNLSATSTYYYIVTSTNIEGESEASAEISASPTYPLASIPAGLIASAGNSSALLSWNPSAYASSYNLYWSTSPNPTKSANKITNVASPYQHTGLTNGTTYYYRLSALNMRGETGLSSETAAIPAIIRSSPSGDMEINLGNGVKMNLVETSSGSFIMGSQNSEANRRSDESPQHTVIVSAFYIGKYEVTQNQFNRIMGYNPSYFVATQAEYWVGYPDTLNQPVESVSWYEAIEFCNKLSINQGLANVYTINKSSADPNNLSSSSDPKWLVTADWNADGYRLPTEAEWEYACRGGTQGMHFWSSDYSESTAKQYCWFDQNSNPTYWTTPHAEKGGTQPTGTKLPNAWGMCDMNGNVWEWCWDWYNSAYYSSSQIVNPRGNVKGAGRVIRGGSWTSLYGNSSYDLRSAGRAERALTTPNNSTGFRVVRTRR
ncbi:MAG: SUMF1/EgtB/PvdO family nonheme iron enzyme [Candidatus Riflebacteria bacterium]|nr:SUMF1/EgtB/PvdO family nonheme iron enzyme [Candidatus Riflebacteria bacterium]